MASMTPKQLTTMFELISGSEAFRGRYEELQARKTAADDQLRFVFSKKKTVVAERKQKLEQKTEAEKHLKMQRELVGASPAEQVHVGMCMWAGGPAEDAWHGPQCRKVST